VPYSGDQPYDQMNRQEGTDTDQAVATAAVVGPQMLAPEFQMALAPHVTFEQHHASS
jgi:hypothetical protein